MYSIGEISKIVNVSTDTLRYYDEIGLLTPSRIDPSSKYRYYSDEQVKFILLIMELKEYGFTLQEIKELSKCKDPTLLKNAFYKRLEALKIEVENATRLIDVLTKRINEFPSEEDNRMNRKKILIVDDISLVRFLIRNILEKYNYEIIGEATNGLEAVEKYMELKPDLVIMDIVIPIMDGIYATQKILERDKNARILMCSNMSQAVIVLEALKSGACGFLSKPFQEIDLYDEVNIALTNPRYFDPEYLAISLTQIQACNHGSLDDHRLLMQTQMKQLIQLLSHKADGIDFDDFILQSINNNLSSPPDHYLSLRNANIGIHKLNGLTEYFHELTSDLTDNLSKILTNNLSNTLTNDLSNALTNDLINHKLNGSCDYLRLRLCSIEQSLSLDTRPLFRESINIGMITIPGQELPIAIIPYEEIPEAIADTLLTGIFDRMRSLLPEGAKLQKSTGREFQLAYHNVYPQVNVIMELATSNSVILLTINIPHEIANMDEFYNHILEWKLTKL